MISLKGTLHKEVIEYFQNDELRNDCNIFIEYDKGYGKIEERKAFVTENIDWLQKSHNWPGLKSIGLVISKVQKKDKVSTEPRDYISSLESNAEKFNKAARSHWSIENKLHWRLDVLFNEDKCCIRNDNAAENMDILRK